MEAGGAGRARPPRGARPAGWAALGLLVLVATVGSAWALHPYRYGGGDQVLTIPFVLQWAHPDLFPDDPAVAQRKRMVTLLWPALGLFHRLTGAPLEGIFLPLYLLSLLGTFGAFARLVHTLSGDVLAAALGVFLALFPKLALAGVPTGDPALLTRAVALPFVLSGLERILAGRGVPGFGLLGISTSLHPLSGVYGSALGLGLLLAEPALRRPRALLRPLAALGAGALPALVWALAVLPPGSALRPASEPWLAILGLRSPHHIDPRWFGAEAWAAAITAVAVLLSLGAWAPPGRRRALCAAISAVVGLCTIAFLFGWLLPIHAVVVLQLFRSTVLLHWLAYAVVAWRLARALRAEAGAHRWAEELVVCAAVLWGARDGPHALAGVALLMASAAAFRRVFHRPLPETAGVLALSAGIALLAVGAHLGGRRPVPGVDQPEPWLEVQRFARRRSAPDAIFIVPPSRFGFRVVSRRSIYGDWKDGTQTFFDPAFGAEWLRRMHVLGYRPELPVRGFSGKEHLEAAYRSLSAEALRALAAELGRRHSEVYLVAFPDGPKLGAPIFGNGSHRVFRLPRGGAAGRPVR